MLTVVQRSGGMRGKPLEEVRGYSSRLPWAWDGLCFGVPLNDASLGAARDLVANAAPAVNGTALGWSKDNRGNVAAHLDAATGIDYAFNPAHNAPSTAITAYVRMRRASTGLGGVGIFCKLYDSSVQPIVSWAIQHSDAADNTLAANLPETSDGMVQNYWEAPGYVLPTTVWVSVFLRWRSGEVPVLDILGERGETLTSAPAPWALGGSLIYSSGQPMRLNAMTSNSDDHYDADYSQAMLWDRKLTNTEVQALVEDPYGWYSPRRSTVGVSSPYAVVFGGGEMRGAAGGIGGMY